MPQPWSIAATPQSAWADTQSALGALLSGNAPVYTGGSYQQEKMKAQHAALAYSNKSDDGPGLSKYKPKPKGPTAAEQLAAKKAAKLAARKKKGQAGRKKYELAMTMQKKMKLLFN